MAQVICVEAQARPQRFSVGENTKMNASALFTGGYTGDYGDAGTARNHALTFGFDGKINGYYYNPQFLLLHCNAVLQPVPGRFELPIPDWGKWD